MFDLVAEASLLFSKMISFYEVAAEAHAVFTCAISDLPSSSILEKFLCSFCKCDRVEFSIKSYLDFKYSSLSPETFKYDYEHFIDSSEPEDQVTINIHINKAFDDRDSLAIYSFDHFISHYAKCSFYELMHEISIVLKKRNHLVFHVIDKEVNISTGSICLYNDISMLTSSTIDRKAYFAHLNDASLFLNRNDLSLSPYDFRILHDVSSDTTQLRGLLTKLETIFAYIYLSYSAQIIHDQVILQLSPSAPNIVLAITEVVPCQYICDLFHWAFESDHTIERVGIIRNLLELNCKSASDLQLKDDSLLLSAKSNYILFQKKTIDKYIDLKNSISLTIVEATNHMQEILQTLVDAVRNNFVAVIMFLITVIITDSVNWEDLFTGTVLNADLLYVIKVFCVSSFLYLLVTLLSIYLKWRFLLRGYKEIKSNYTDILDSDDLNRAFDNDKAINYVTRTILFASSITSIIWIIFLFVLYLLAW